MKYFISFIVLCLSLKAFSQNPDYNPTLAKELGADEYGMKMYTFVILKTGSETVSQDSTQNLMRGHLENINRLAEEGLLTVAGPFGKNELDYRGLFIFSESDTAKVKELLLSDPAVAAGVFETEVIPWYGSAALPTYMETHEKIAKRNP